LRRRLGGRADFSISRNVSQVIFLPRRPACYGSVVRPTTNEREMTTGIEEHAGIRSSYLIVRTA